MNKIIEYFLKFIKKYTASIITPALDPDKSSIYINERIDNNLITLLSIKTITTTIIKNTNLINIFGPPNIDSLLFSKLPIPNSNNFEIAKNIINKANILLDLDKKPSPHVSYNQRGKK
jgi:hypothetical protein